MSFMLIVWLLCAILCAILAPSMNRSAGAWAVLGIIFGIGAVIALVVMGEKRA